MLRAAAFVAVLGVLAAVPARAQMDSREGIALQNQILELRRDLQVLRDQVGRGVPAAGTYRATPAPAGGGGEMTAQLLDRVNALEEEVRRLRGRLDESENARQRQYDELNKQIGDLNFKLGGGSGAASPAAAPAPRPTSGGEASSSPAAAPRRTPESLLQEGNAALARRDYAAAEANAREVLAAPRSPRSTDAQLLLAQALSGKRDYAQAAIAYDDAFKRNPSGSRAQDALLGLANSLNSLNEKRAACETLGRLPSPRPDLREAVAAARQRAGCR